MRIGGNPLVLLCLPVFVSAFVQFNLQALIRDISLFSGYKFTILSSFDLTGRYMKSGDNIQTTFPGEVPIIDTSVPSMCYRLDASSVQHPLLNCKVSTGNQIFFDLDVDVDTVVSPLVYVLGLAKNPDCVKTTASFAVKQYRNSTLVDSRVSGITATYDPGKMTGLSIGANTLVVYRQATYTIAFKPQHNVPQHGKIKVIFPTADFQLGALTSVTVTGSINSSTAVLLNPSEPSPNILIADGLFGNDILSASDSPIVTVTIYPVTNPDSMRTSQSITIYTTTMEEYFIDKGDAGLTVTPNQPRSINDIGITATPPTVMLPALYSFNMIPDLGFPSGGKLTITIPSTITIGSVSCSFVLGFTPSAGSCELSGQTISTAGVYYTKNADNLYLVFTVNGLSNPPDAVQTTSFQISTYDAWGNLICQNLLGPQITAVPNVITVNSVTRRAAKVSADGPYTLSFTLATAVPQAAQIKIILPQDQVSAYSLSCHRVSGSIVLTENVCSQTLTATSSAYVLVVEEWCSTHSAGCPAGTKLTLSLAGVRNLPYVKKATSSVEIYTLNALMTGIIDSITSGVVFAPGLEVEVLGGAAVSRSGDVVGANTLFAFSFTTPVELVPASVIVLWFPQAVAFQDDSGGSLQAFLGTAATSISASALYADGSVKTVALDQVCIAGCTAMATIHVSLSGVDNPRVVQPLATAYSVSAYVGTNYQIAASSADCSAVGPLVTDLITNVVVTRSSNNIQTAVQIDLSFLHATAFTSAVVINITVPNNLLVAGSGLACIRKADSTVLPCVGALTDSGGYSSLTVSGYCPSQCAKSTTIQLTLKGLTTPASVKPVSGPVGISTTDNGFKVDEGTLSDISVQLTPLQPGTLHNLTIDPDNPTVGETTSYRLVLTTTHGIPAGAQVLVTFPSEIGVTDRSPADNLCSAYIQMEASVQCAAAGGKLYVQGGFVTALAGSWMLGFRALKITNPGVVSTSAPILVELQTSDGFTIDSATAAVNFYAAQSACESQCKQCAGSAGNCIACALPGGTPYQRGGTCMSVCTANSFLVSELKQSACITCHYTCNTCTSSLSTECVECVQGLVKTNRSCLPACPTGTVNTNGVCVNVAVCAAPCMTCSASSSFCLSCDPASTSPVLDPINGNCVATQTGLTHYCPSGYFQSAAVCTQCDKSCSKCTNAASFCTACKTVYGTPLLNLIDNTCVASCPAGITTLQKGQCVPCDASCLTCSGPAAVNCVTCQSVGTKYKTSGGQCVAVCGNGTYHFDNADGTFACVGTCNVTAKLFIDTASNYCRPCFDSCLTCSAAGNQNCLSCDPASSVPFLTADGQCLSSCPSTQFTYTLAGAQLCYFSCPSTSFNFMDVSGKKTCIATCPTPGFYINSATNFCSPCDSSCLTCSGSTANNCLTCDRTGSNPYLTDQFQCVPACPVVLFTFTLNSDLKCFSSCPTGSYNFDGDTGKVCTANCGAKHWVDVSANYCRGCFTQCKTCNGGTNSNCTSCDQSGSFPYMTDDGQCVSACPSDLFRYTIGTAMKCVSACPTETYYSRNADGTVSCVAVCDTSNKLYVDDKRFCSLCDPSCLTCASASACTACDASSANQYLVANGLCVSSCADGWFTYTIGGAKKCLATCPQPSYNFVDTGKAVCASTCASQKFFVNTATNYCSPCDLSCLTCSGPSAFNCLTCDLMSAAPLPTADGQCVSACPSNMFLYTLSTVPTCFLTCPPGTYYYQSLTDVPKCVDTCSSGFYLDVTTKYCYKCNSACKTCSGVTASNCLSCDTTSTVPFLSDSHTCLVNCGGLFKYTLNDSMKCYSVCPSDSYNFVDLKTGEKLCTAVCGSGFFVDAVANFCRQCDASCLTCNGTTATACLSCPVATPYFTDSNQCLVQCPASSYRYTLNGSQKCYTTCPNGSFNFEGGNGRECVGICVPGFYVDSANNYCRACFSTCLTCNGISSSNCLTCDKSGSTPYLTDTHQCVSQCAIPSPYVYTANGDLKCFSICPAGFFMYDDGRGGDQKCVSLCAAGNFLDSTNAYCKKCDVSCASCNGTSAASCLTCDPSGATPYLTQSNQCLSQCPSTSYLYEIDSAHRCYSQCPFSSFGFKTTDGVLTCISACGSGFYLDSDTNTCHKCSPTCRTCRGIAATDCLTCDKSSTSSFLTDAGECVAVCPSALYVYNPSGEKRCLNVCPAGSYNADNTAGYRECVFACGAGFYVDEANNYCRACSPSCRTCTGGTTCVTCNKTGQTPFYTDEQKCVAQCPAAMYLYSPNGELRCVTTCPAGFYSFDDPVTAAKTCIATCGDGFYVDQPTNSCRKCYKSCLTCSAGTSQSCSSCGGDVSFLTDGGECVSQCPSQYFTYKTAKKCVSVCPPSMFSEYSSTGKECGVTCSGSFFVEKDSNFCKPCAASCLTCSGGMASQCVTCSTSGAFPYLSSDGQCVSLCAATQYVYSTGGVVQCLMSCPSGTYHLETTSRQCVDACPLSTYPSGTSCEKCDQTCGKCKGPASTDCITCKPDLAFFKSACMAVCPLGYKNVNGSCVVACGQTSCNECQLATASNCSQCVPGFILYNSTCYYSCPDATFPASDSCSVCHTSCRTCKGPREDQCTSCSSPLSLYLGKCLATCPPGLESLAGQCQVPVPCEPPCNDCIQGTADLCLSCRSSTPILMGTKCISNCPDHFYSLNETACARCDDMCESCSGAPGRCETCGNSTFLTVNYTCAAACPAGFSPSNETHVCIEDPAPPGPILRSDSQAANYRLSSYYPVSLHIGVFVACALLILISKLYRPDMHISEANLLALLSAVDMMHRLSLLTTIWQYAATPNPYEIGVSAGLLVGSVCLSLMFLVLYMDPVVESSAAIEVFVSQHKWSYALLRFACYLFGIHFVRIFYGGLFGLEVLSNFKTLGSSSAFRFPLEKLCAIQAAAMLIPQILQNLSVLAVYETNSDPFHLAAFGIPVNALLLGAFLYDYLRGPWR